MKPAAGVFIFILLCGTVSAEDRIDAEALSFEDLFYYAGQNPVTEVRRQNMNDANAELVRRGADTLRFYLDHAHIKNIWYVVKINDLMPRPDYEGVPADKALPIFKEALESPHKRTRRIALYYLMRYERPEGSLDWVVRHLDKDDDRNMAIRLLGEWGAVEQAERIGGFLKSLEERRRVSAVIALGDLQQEESVPLLIEMLKDDVFTVRFAASRALVEMDARKETREALNQAMEGSDVQYLRHLIQTAGALRDRRSIKSLRRLQDHQDEGVRYDVKRALHEIEHGPSADDPSDPESLAEALGAAIK